MDLARGLTHLQDNFLQPIANTVDGINQLADLILTRYGQAGAQIACGILAGQLDHVTQRAGQHPANEHHKQAREEHWAFGAFWYVYDHPER